MRVEPSSEQKRHAMLTALETTDMTLEQSYQHLRLSTIYRTLLELKNDELIALLRSSTLSWEELDNVLPLRRTGGAQRP
jgi:Fe2+ or Zn2+ uptake regulation protein